MLSEVRVRVGSSQRVLRAWKTDAGYQLNCPSSQTRRIDLCPAASSLVARLAAVVVAGRRARCPAAQTALLAFLSSREDSHGYMQRS